ncbi:hypothetical protein G6F61_013660 [Rhizopus arrhizus]|jgi:hypothetical protein|nr:hypothetical protein G6F37_013764 [Rhizopus arrhizus]KAG1152399.1 hypothetical protein G6F38_000559 [Rhizopus arrhizus]KAG1364795.1 hypothetical protein G6F61_013660 [Rhizopus arrhizus]
MSCLKKQVRFDTEHIVIIDTYSPLDYDRGSFPIQYKLNPNIALRIPSPPPLIPSDDSEDSASSPDGEVMTKKKKLPKLSIDTSMCAGPLFFTKLSTNHSRNKEQDNSNDYLIPI